MSKYQAYPEYKDSGVEWLGNIPTSWTLSKIAWHFRAQKGRNGQQLTKEYCGLHAGKYPVYSGQTENLGIMGKIDSFEFDTGVEGVLFSTTVGAKAMTLNHLRGKFSLSQNCMIISSYGNSITTRFAYYHFQPLFTYERGLIPEHMQASFRMEDLYRYPIAAPSIEEQTQIANFLDHETAKIDALIEKQQQLISLLQEKRQAVISHAVTKGLNPDVPMKDSGVEWLGKVPEHWEVTRLKYLVKEPLLYGANEAALDTTPQNPRFVRITDIMADGCLKDDTFRSLPEALAKPYMLNDGDVLFARSGATVGKSFIYRKVWGRCCFAGYLIKASIDEKITPAEWVYFNAQTNFYWQWISSTQIQSTIQNVSAEKYNGFFFPVPPKQEALEIVSHLNEKLKHLNNLEGHADRLVHLLQERRTSLISAAVTGKIDVRNWQAPSQSPSTSTEEQAL